MNPNAKLLITGGAGFIGSAVIRYYLTQTDYQIINLDKLTYASNLNALASVQDSHRYFFEQGDIANFEDVRSVFLKYQPDAVIHLAAESHVDRSIRDPGIFIKTNIVGTYHLLVAAHERGVERFLYVSTDEVYGDLEESEPAFTEKTPYAPSSPYSASKASSDHLVRAWYRTYGLPVMISNCSNNYGPWQYPEKLIPLTILNALQGKALPIYGDGSQIRDWLYVEDHARALALILERGVPGQTYNIGGNNERRNIEVVQSICEILDEFLMQKPAAIKQFEDLMTFVTDRPGHDKRYAIDPSKIKRELGWEPMESFEAGLRKTVLWYVEQAGLRGMA